MINAEWEKMSLQNLQFGKFGTSHCWSSLSGGSGTSAEKSGVSRQVGTVGNYEINRLCLLLDNLKALVSIKG